MEFNRNFLKARAENGLSSYALAQLNIALFKESLQPPVLAEFVANLDRINASEERSPGINWRSKTDEGNPTPLCPSMSKR